MIKTIHGTIRGRTIELTEDPGLSDGQEVCVQMSPITLAAEPSGEGLRRSAGALADEWTEEDDRILDEIHRDRKRESRQDIPE